MDLRTSCARGCRKRNGRGFRYERGNGFRDVWCDDCDPPVFKPGPDGAVRRRSGIRKRGITAQLLEQSGPVRFAVCAGGFGKRLFHAVQGGGLFRAARETGRSGALSEGTEYRA